jgi:hypothetical protein
MTTTRSINEHDSTNFIVSPKNPRDVPLWYYFPRNSVIGPAWLESNHLLKKSCQRYYLILSNQFYFDTINWTRTLNPPGNRLLIRAAVAGGCVIPGRQRCSNLQFLWRLFDRHLSPFFFSPNVFERHVRPKDGKEHSCALWVIPDLIIFVDFDTSSIYEKRRENLKTGLKLYYDVRDGVAESSERVTRDSVRVRRSAFRHLLTLVLRRKSFNSFPVIL